MNRTVSEHIQSLEEKRAILAMHIMHEPDNVKRNNLESELRAVESALALYRSALEIEARVSTDRSRGDRGDGAAKQS
jgi:hypothetical protein